MPKTVDDAVIVHTEPADGVHLEAQALVFTRDLSQAEWEALGGTLARTVESGAWAIGDWLVYGGGRQRENNSRWTGSGYADAERLTGIDRETLSVYFRVSAHFPRETRIAGCSWTHHKHALVTPFVDRAPVLQEAARAHMTVATFRAHCATVQDKAAPKVPDPVRTAARPSTYHPVEVVCPKCAHVFVVKGHKRRRD